MIGIWKTFSLFATILIISILFGSGFLNLVKAVKVGDWNEALVGTGGKVFEFDHALLRETQYLLDNSIVLDFNSFDITFHLLYAVTILFFFFLFVVMVFKFGNWISGKAQWNPVVDLLWVGVAIIIFFSLEFAYSYYIIGEIIFPMQGVYEFVKNLPQIVMNIF